MGGKAVMALELMPAMSAPVALPLRGRHAPVGRVDKTVTGFPDQAPGQSMKSSRKSSP